MTVCVGIVEILRERIDEAFAIQRDHCRSKNRWGGGGCGLYRRSRMVKKKKAWSVSAVFLFRKDESLVSFFVVERFHPHNPDVELYWTSYICTQAYIHTGIRILTYHTYIHTRKLLERCHHSLWGIFLDFFERSNSAVGRTRRRNGETENPEKNHEEDPIASEKRPYVLSDTSQSIRFSFFSLDF